MRKRGLLLCALLLLSLAAPAPARAEEDAIEYETPLEYYRQLAGQNISVNVYNWGEYISDGTDGMLDVNGTFEELTGIRVNYTNFATNEELYSKLRGGGAQYDVVIPSDYMVGRMAAEDMLEPLDFANIPNFEFIDANFRNPAYDPGNRFSVPYTWGVVGIVYNTELILDDEIRSWDVLWDERYLGDILMFQNPRDAFAIAQIRLGYSLNDTDERHLRECLELLKAQKPLVQAYVMDEIYNKMLNGEAILAPYYAGDAYSMIGENDVLAFAVPDEGTNIFVDAMCVPKGARQKKAAEMYINFMCEPAISAANGEYIGYALPSAAAVALLDEEVRGDPVANPPQEIIDNAEYFNTLPQETNLLMDRLWTELMSSDERYSRLLIPSLMVAAVAASIAINLWRMSRKKRQRSYF